MLCSCIITARNLFQIGIIKINYFVIVYISYIFLLLSYSILGYA